MERKERLEKILNKNIGNPNHDKEGKFTFAPYKKYPGLQQSVKKLITIKKAEKGLTEKYLEAVDEEREKLFKKYNQNKELEDDELSKWNDGWYMWDEKDKASFSDIDIALSKAIFKESKSNIDVYRTQVDSKNPGKMNKAEYASWSPNLEYVCKWARFLAGYDSKIDIFKNKPTLENIKIIPDVLYSQRFLRNKAKYQEYVLENKSSIEAFERDLSRHDVYEKYINSIDLISKDSVPFDFYIKYNGGPGSGNFNPGQGRGIGKPTSGIKFSKSVNNYFKTANKDSVNTLNEEIKNAISDGLDLSDVKFEIVDSLGNTNGQVVTDDAETMNPKFTLRFEKSVFNNFYPKENDKEIYKWSGQADSSTRGMIRHELGHLFHFKKSLQAGITPDIADDFGEFIVRKEADKLGIDIDKDNSNDNFSRASRMDYGEFIAESYSRPDYSNLTQNVVDAFKNNKYSKEDYSKYLDEDLENLMKMEEDNSVETNGGPGSGNFNPGQGRGVGKPSNKSKKLTYEEYAEKFKKLTRSEKEELDKEYPEYADRYFKELMERHIQRERDEKSFGTYEKDNSHPHFDLDKVPTELKYALDITPTQGLKKYDPKTQTLIDLKNRKEYYNEEKGIWVRVISMSPRDYSNTIIENNNGHYTSMKEIEDRTSKGGIDMYVEKFKNRERQEVPYIKFNKEGKFSGEQEGFHRSFAADEIGDKEIPVLIVTDYYGKQPFLNHGRDITKDVENYYASKAKKNSLARKQRLDLIMNGGPGSGNFNPGQGRGVGKPANGSNKSSTTFSVDDYSKERLNEVLEKYGVETDTNIGIAISNAAWRNGNKEDYKKVEKILEERYGEDWYDNDEAEKDKDYLEYLERKAKRIEELQKKIYSELGIEFDSDSFWVSKDIYDGIQKAIKEGKLKEFINGDTPAAKEDPNFVRDPESAIGFYRQKSFNFDNGNFNVEVMNSSSESGYSDISEDNFINKSDYDNFMKRKMVKVNNDEVRSWYTILDKAGTYPPISRAEERSLQEYNLASAVNQQLREGKTSRTAENIASAINKKYSHSDEVYRGIRGDFAKKISSLKKGDTVTDKGFMSTSSIIGGDDSGAAKFGKTIMKIKTKSGFGQSINMAPYVKDMRYLDEGEILLQKDTTVKYTGNSSKTIDKDGNDIMIYEFEVE